MFTPMHADTMDGEPAEAVASVAPPPMHARSRVNETTRTARTIPTARVNLMPPEVLLGRRVGKIKRKIVIALVLVLVTALAGLLTFKLNASKAASGLQTELAAADALKREQQTYSELLKIDTVTRDVDRSLTSVMGDDVAWDTYLAALNASAPTGIRITNIAVVLSGVAEPSDAGTPSGSLDTSGAEHVGSLTVTGLAPSHEVVAAWVKTMTDVEGFLVPYILGTSVLEGGADIQFTIEVTLSSAIRSLRYAATPPGTATEGQGG